MAEHESFQERTEQATPKRQQEAKKKGQVPRSKELNTFVMLSLGLLLTFLVLKLSLDDFLSLVRASWQIEQADRFEDVKALVLQTMSFLGFLWLMLFLALGFLPVISAGLLGGIPWSVESLSFKWSRMSLLKGLQRSFGKDALMGLVLAIVKVSWVGIIAYVVFDFLLLELMHTSVMAFEEAVKEGLWLLFLGIVFLSASFFLPAVIDVPYQIIRHQKQLKMTKQEIKDEMKETEGRPEVKGQIRARQREMAERRMLHDVPKADVIITNPDHFAIAIRYEQGSSGAPKVVAKGVDWMAEQIKMIAKQNNIPTFEAPPLARAIYYSTDWMEEIPEGLYMAVAKILAYFYQLRLYKQGLGQSPVKPRDLEVPIELQRDKAGKRLNVA